MGENNPFGINGCPCYTCLVAASCPAKYPTLEEWIEIDKQCDEEDTFSYEHHIPSFEEDEAYFNDPVVKILESCPYMLEWNKSKDIGEFEGENFRE